VTSAALPALAEATVTHVRRGPVSHSFRYRTAYWLFDYDDPPRLRWPLRLVAQFRARDHVDVRAALSREGLGAERIVTLAHAGAFGYVFNPISVHWCYPGDTDTPVAVVAEVHNTYAGRHAYVLHPDVNGDDTVDKAMYVSPFNATSGRYVIRVSEPGDRIAVSVALHRQPAAPFTATLTARRLPATTANVCRLAARYPFTPLRTSALIRRQGVALWARGLTVQPR
jgi:DUF1365 family protein